MTVQPAISRNENGFRRRRPGRGRHAATHAPSRGAVRELRDGGPLEDTALYNCHCGFVFEAPVLTSVDCPHCGNGQAW
jgi:hypothetical protein